MRVPIFSFLILCSTAFSAYVFPLTMKKSNARSLISTEVLNPLTQSFSTNFIIQVGGQSIDVALDTGSQPLWIPSSTCQFGCFVAQSVLPSGSTDTCLSLVSNPQPVGPCTGSLYNNALSPSYSLSSIQEYTSQYGDGSTVIGSFSQDTLTIGSLSYPGFKFGLVNRISTNSGESMSGILGFAPPESAGTTCLLSSMFSDPTITVKQFALSFPSSLTASGEMSIGGTNTALYIGTPLVIPIKFSSYWSFQSQTIHTVSSSGVASSAGNPGIADTGTSYLILPTADAMAICTALGLPFDSNRLTCVAPCSSFKSAPNFFLVLGPSLQIEINVQDNFYLQISSTTCSLAIQGGSQGLVIVGAAVLRQYYTVWDFTNFNANSLVGNNFGSGSLEFYQKVGGLPVTPSSGGATTVPASVTGTASSKIPSVSPGSIGSTAGTPCSNPVDYLSAQNVPCASGKNCNGIYDCAGYCVTQWTANTYSSDTTCDNGGYTDDPFDFNCGTFNYDSGACSSNLGKVYSRTVLPIQSNGALSPSNPISWIQNNLVLVIGCGIAGIALIVSMCALVSYFTKRSNARRNNRISENRRLQQQQMQYQQQQRIQQQQQIEQHPTRFNNNAIPVMQARVYESEDLIRVSHPRIDLPPPLPPRQLPLPPNWCRIVDTESNRVYYFNERTMQTQWARPT